MAINGKTESDFGRIGVLMGGPSSEREISLKSGKAVYAALNRLGLEAVAIDISSDGIEENIRLIKAYNINCAFIALHGRFGEDGSIQHILEVLKIPYTGSGVQASRLAMDKAASLEIFEKGGLKIPGFEVVDNKRRKRSNHLGLPLVVKPATHGSSIGLSIIDKEENLDKAVDLAFRYDERVIIQEYIKGRELTVGILDEQALPVIEIIPKNFFFDYEAKYTQGMTDYVVPAKLEETVSERLKAAGLKAHQLLGCSGCSRADIILDASNSLYILEINTIPGLTETSLLPKAARSAGIEFGELCFKLISLAYEKKKIKNKN